MARTEITDLNDHSASIAAQALDAGLVDEVTISLVPVPMGKGIPYFADLAHAPHRFDDPVIIPGSRVTHLRYAVRRTGSSLALTQRERNLTISRMPVRFGGSGS